MLIAAAAALAILVGSILLARLCFRMKDVGRKKVLQFAVIFSNAGFMGIPLEYALLGADGVFFGAMYVVVFNLVCWSLGVAGRGAGDPAICVQHHPAAHSYQSHHPPRKSQHACADAGYRLLSLAGELQEGVLRRRLLSCKPVPPHHHTADCGVRDVLPRT